MNTNVLSESYTVLIVDESAENRATVKRYLNQDPDHTYRFEETELGKAGLELCVSRQPNLILLNCSLPDITGLEFLKALTARMTEGHCPVIVLADETSAAGCMKYGAQDYLVKDKLTPESLRHVVQVSLQTYQLKLQERHFLATSILESISEAFCALDAEERFTYVNHRAEEFWNISRKELLGKKFGEIFPRMAGIAEYQYLRQAITEQTPLNFESYISAIQRWIKIKVYPANDGVSVYFEDITAQKQAEEQLRRWNEELEKRVEERTAALTAEIEEHKRTEEALRESEERFRLVAENSTDVIWTMNMEGQFTYVSPSVLQLRGYTPEEVLKQSMAEALTPKSVIIAREGLLGILQVTQEGNPGRRLDQMEQPCKDGSTVWTEVSTCLMYASNGEFKGILGISRDISERKRAEEALRESEEKFAAIFQSSPVATLISNLADGLILDANSQAQEFFGYRHDLLVGHTSLELNIWLDPTLRDQLQQKLIQQGSIRNFETSFRRSNGEIRHALASYELLELGGKTLVLSLLHDITEIAKANRAQAMLAAIVESSEDAILSVNLAGCLQSWNAGATKLFGYTASEIMGQHFSLLVTSEQLEEQSRIVAKILGGEVVGHFDTFRRHKNGTKIAVSMAVSPMKTSSGEIIGVCTTIRDITARKEAEEALRQSEMRNRLFAEAIRNADDAIVITDAVLDSPGPQIIFANPAFTTMTGYTLEEAYGKTPRILQGAKSDRAVLDCLRRNLAAGENFQGEIINYRKDGSELYQEFRISPVKDEQGKTTNFIAIKRDITARKQAEAALRESEERYRFLAENSTDTISRLSYAGVFEYVSPASQKIIGFAPEELVGHTFLEFVHPDDHEQFLKLLSNWQGQNNFLVTYRACCKNDQYIWVEASVHLTSNPDTGQVLNVIMVTRDITERRKMEEALAAEKLKAKNLESLGVLAGGIAHSFNNALTGVTGYMSLAKLELEETSEAYTCLEEAEKATQHLTELAQRLVPFASGGAPVKQKIKLENIIKNAASFMTQNPNLRYHFDLPTEIWLVSADSVQIREALQNLIKNALEAMPEGGIIGVKATNVTLEANQIPLLNPGRYVRVTVQDQGCGIRSEELARIFDPYYTTKFMGNGLGLTLSYSIIRRHGGQLVVESEWRKGTTVHFYLPTLPEEAGV